MEPFQRFQEEQIPQSAQQQVGFSPNRVADIGQEILQQYQQGVEANRFSDTAFEKKRNLVAENAQTRIDNTQKYYGALGKLVEFSDTLNTVAQFQAERFKENQKAQANIEVLNEVWKNGATDEQKQQLQSIRTEAQQETNIRADAADASIKETGNNDIARWINSTNPWRAMYRAEALARSRKDEYPAELEAQLRNSEDELPGLGIRVKDAKGATQRRAAVSYIRNKYWQESGLSIINPALLDEKLFPEMKKAEGVILSTLDREDRVVVDSARRDEILANLPDAEDIGLVVRELAQLSNANGAPTGNKAAWNLINSELADLYAEGSIDAGDLDRMAQQPDPVVKGKTIAEARKGWARDIVINGSSIIGNVRSAEKQNLTIQGESWQENYIKENFTNEDGTLKQPTAQDVLKFKQQWYNTPYGRIQPDIWNNFTATYGPKADQEAQVAKYEALLKNNGVFTSDMVKRDLPSAYWGQYMPYAVDSTENKAKAAASKNYLGNLEKRVLKQFGSETGDPLSPKVANAKSNIIMRDMRSMYEQYYAAAKRQNPEGSPEQWAQTAEIETDKYFAENTLGKEREKYLQGIDQIAATPIVASQANKEWVAKINGAYGADGDKALDKPGVFYTQADLQDISKKINEGMYVPDWKMQQLALRFNVPINELITRQLKAFDPNAEMIPPTPTTQALQAVPADVRAAALGDKPGFIRTNRAIGQLNLGDGTYNDRAPMIRGEDPNPYIRAAAQKYGIPPAILASLLDQESSYSDDVVFGSRHSTAGAIGIAQFLPGTAAEMGIDPYDWKQSIEGAAKYLDHMMKNYGFTLEEAIYAYNAGPGTISRYGTPPNDPGASTENRNYFPEIQQRARDKYRKILLQSYSYGNLEALNDPALRRQNFVI